MGIFNRLNRITTSCLFLICDGGSVVFMCHSRRDTFRWDDERRPSIRVHGITDDRLSHACTSLWLAVRLRLARIWHDFLVWVLVKRWARWHYGRRTIRWRLSVDWRRDLHTGAVVLFHSQAMHWNNALCRASGQVVSQAPAIIVFCPDEDIII